MSHIRFSADNLPYPVQETTIDNTTPSVVSLADKDKTDKSATCLASHNSKSDRYTDKSTQTPVPSDKCLSSLEYEMTTKEPQQCSDSSTISSQTPVPSDSSLGYETMTEMPRYVSESYSQVSTSSLGYESMTEKPYQCSETFNKCSQTSVELSYQVIIPRKVGHGFLVYQYQGGGEKPNNLHINADQTTDDITIMSSTTLQLRTKYDKSANCLANERSNPTGPLDQSSAPSDEHLSELECESTTVIAQQCTEESTDGFRYKSGHHSVAVSSKITVPSQEIDCTPYAGSSPRCGFWTTSNEMDHKAATKNPNEKMLLLPTLQHFLSMTRGNYDEVEQQDI